MRTYHHGALAEAMVDQALADVRAHGAERMSLRGIAQAVHVSPSAAYNHFADKDALLQAVGRCGLAALDERMTRVLAAHPGDSDEEALTRFTGLGRAYLAFAVEDPHLFRLTFSPVCKAFFEDPSGRDPAVKEPAEAGAYRKLIAALDDLDSRGMLRDGIRDGLDETVWAAVHGMACLIIEEALPVEAGEALVNSTARLVLNAHASRS
ncbi:MAG: TetR/AcrR family transcriptional regulator [Actinomycetales bacterium]